MKSRKIWVILIIILLAAGAAAGFLLFRRLTFTEKNLLQASAPKNLPGEVEEFTTLRLYYPVGNHLELVEKKVPKRTKQMAIADAVVEEYFKGPGNGVISQVSPNVKLIGLYKDPSQMLYLDLSDELRRNFQGDALTEFLLLKGLYDSLISNLQDVRDIMVLVEGKEAETLGGHLYLKFPLKNTVAYDYKGDTKVTDEQE
jgi:spore germination protein GerM